MCFVISHHLLQKKVPFVRRLLEFENITCFRDTSSEREITDPCLAIAVHKSQG